MISKATFLILFGVVARVSLAQDEDAIPNVPDPAPAIISPSILQPTIIAPAKLPTIVSPVKTPTVIAPAKLPTIIAPAKLPTIIAPAKLPTIIAPAKLPTIIAPAKTPAISPVNIPTIVNPTIINPTIIGPTIIDPPTGPPEIPYSHLTCFKGRVKKKYKFDAMIRLIANNAQGQYTVDKCYVNWKKIDFCIPSTKQIQKTENIKFPDEIGGVFPQPILNDFICYTMKCDDLLQLPDGADVADQFGRKFIYRDTEKDLLKVCVPAWKLGADDNPIFIEPPELPFTA